MKKTIIAGLLAAMTGGVSAHSNDCDYSVDYNINIDDQQIRFHKKSGDNIVFSGDELLINGKSLSLTSRQRQTSEDFQKQTRAIVPKIAYIAVEGAEIGVKAATIALTGLFGDSEDVQKDLIDPIEAISTKIKANISETSLNTEELEKSFEDDFENEIEELVETAISKYSGKMVSQIIGSIFSGDEEDMKDFEFRMENMEHDIERYVEKHAEALEEKADELCVDLKAIAKLDEQLEGIAGYPEDGVIQEDSDHGFKISGLSINSD